MTNSSLDQSANDGVRIAAETTLADPFRRRLLSAAALCAGSSALLAAGIPLPALAASVGRAAGGIIKFNGIPVSTADTVTLAEG